MEQKSPKKQPTAIQKLLEQLEGTELTLEERNLCTGVILDSLGALPLRDILYLDVESQTLIVQGKPVTDMDMALDLRNSAKAALSNRALSAIREQVAYEAQVMAVSKAQNTHDLIFARAALWWGDQVQQKLEILAAEKQLDVYQD